MFSGLFIVLEGLMKSHGAVSWLDGIMKSVISSPLLLGISSAVLSNLISNVPAVLLFKPALAAVSSQKLWLILSLSSTFAGNLTIAGSIANIIVIEGARHEVKISFLEYAKSGAVITILTIGIGLLWFCLL